MKDKSRLEIYFRDYCNQLNALENYVQSIEELLLERHKHQVESDEVLRQVKPVLEASIVLEEVKRIKEKEASEKVINDESAKISELTKSAEELITESEIAAVAENIEVTPVDEGIYSFKVRPFEGSHYIEEYFNMMSEVRNHIDLLYRSSLITLVTTLEVLINNIFYYRAYNYPQSINIDEKSLTLHQIKRLGGFEEAQEFIIEEHVTDMMRESFNKWLEHIKCNFKVKLEKNIEELEPIINETFNRRHLIVHGEGEVNNTYLTRVDEVFKRDLKKGDKLEIDKEYILDRLLTFRVYGAILMYRFWASMEKGSKEIRNRLIDKMAYSLLEKANYEESRLLYETIMNEGLTQSEHFRVKINYWQTFKWNNQYDEIKEEIEKLDLSAAQLDYQLCKDLLQDKFDEALEKFKELVNNKEKEDVIHYLKWPLFKSFLNYPNLIKYLESLGIDIEEDNDEG